MITRHYERTGWMILALAAVAGLLAGCAALPAAAPAAELATPREPLALTIVHSNDTLGYISPCG